MNEIFAEYPTFHKLKNYNEFIGHEKYNYPEKLLRIQIKTWNDFLGIN